MLIPLQMGLDPVGNISLSIQVAILFLLILGLPLVQGMGSKKNFVRHGYLTVIAVLMHTILIFAVMVPSLYSGIGDLGSLSIWEALTT
jgi:hypothetical protein